MGKKKVSKTMPPELTYTQNGAITYASSGDPRVNFFFRAVRGWDAEQVRGHLNAAWSVDALDTLKLIFQTRDCRGGKGEKHLFKICMYWLLQCHPEVLEKNLLHVPTFGSWKDLLALMATPLENAALDLFASQLQKDIAAIAGSGSSGSSSTMEVVSENKPKVSLAIKWAPSEGHKDDKATKAASKLADKLTGGSKSALRDYRKTYVSPLRSHLRITERYMCANEWDKIPYSGVPSRCMNISKKAFKKHDGARFDKFLDDVASGKTSIKGTQLFPHELVKQYFSGAADKVVEEQWKVIINQCRTLGSLSSSLVLSDVSGSMSGTPMEVSVALGLLISELTAPPFQDLVITFHENPTFHQVKGVTLFDRVRDLKAAPWGGSTNFQAVFDMILAKAEQNKLPPAAMPKRIFVISDMQFNSADAGGKFTTNHQAIKQKYKKSNYEMPTIIYWNVAATGGDFPVQWNDQGVGMVAGFSPSIMKSILDAGDLPSPIDIMNNAIHSDRYSCLSL
eukprot:TRINITY_DN112_c0_g1_i2.p1 TRINITY_DN112_c0_g1~~TRINITY_DN112_c0_g1_i2.p1  ORF type:complete len:541 (+),score=130.46 TRINITY_DN112_c0_g1_i2:101-1624(+)